MRPRQSVEKSYCFFNTPTSKENTQASVPAAAVRSGKAGCTESKITRLRADPAGDQCCSTTTVSTHSIGISIISDIHSGISLSSKMKINHCRFVDQFLYIHNHLFRFTMAFNLNIDHSLRLLRGLALEFRV